jgi:hypothetical protein
LLMISTKPPFSVTSLYSMYRSRICLAMMGIRLMGVPVIVQQERGLCGHHSGKEGICIRSSFVKSEKTFMLLLRSVV